MRRIPLKLHILFEISYQDFVIEYQNLNLVINKNDQFFVEKTLRQVRDRYPMLTSCNTQEMT